VWGFGWRVVVGVTYDACSVGFEPSITVASLGVASTIQ
jgi:hypothetical protein